MTAEHDAISKEIDALPGLKERDLGPCGLCGKPYGVPFFYRVRLEQFALKSDAIRRQIGLGMLSGSAAIASIMGPDEDMAKRLSISTVLVCADCAMITPIIAAMQESKG